MAFEFLHDDGTISSLTYAELAGAVTAVANRVARHVPKGGRAAILYPPGIDYVVALLGTMSAGVAAVPAYPPTSPRHLGRLHSLLQSCEADAVLASGHFTEVESQLAAGGPDSARRVPWLLGAANLSDSGITRRPGADDLALIQYTSGSTSAPRGVALTHRQIASNLAMITEAFRLSRDDLAVLWLPPYHDMGLIGGILAPLWVGFCVRLMSPLTFIRDPLRWLDQVSALGATITGGPNFAFERCTRRLGREPRHPLDLAAWRVAFVGAEPVRATTLSRFATAFAPYGFRRESFYPCYGLAEATLMATGGTPGSGAVARAFSRDGLAAGLARDPGSARDSRVLVGCGRSLPGITLRVTDAAGQPMAPGHVGEIRLSGPSMASGYFGEARGQARGETGTAFISRDGEPEVATRDLGFVGDEGELFICGRASDLIIVRGRNVHPEDVELVAEEALAQPGPAIAFGVDAEPQERLIVLREARGLGQEDLAAAQALVRARLGTVLGLQPSAVIIVPGGELPRTSSGKVQRGEARRLFLEGRFGPAAAAAATPAGLPSTDGPAAALRDCVARVLEVPPGLVAMSQSAPALGLDSMGAVTVAENLERRYGLVVSPTDLVSGAPLLQVAARAHPAGAGAGDDGDDGDDGGTDASYGERAIWLHERLGTGPSPYVLSVALDLGAGTDRAALELALHDVLARCPALRTVWAVADGVLRRDVRAEADARPDIQREAGVSEARLGDFLDAASRRPLNPGVAGGTLRATLVETAQGRRLLHLAVHHLAADDWALRLLLADLGACYAARQSGLPLPSPPGTAMGALLTQERRLLSSAEGAALLAAWVARLGGAPQPAPLPGSRPRAGQVSFEAGTQPVPVAPHAAELLRALACAEGTTPFTVLAAALRVLLARLTGQRDIVIGSVASRRGSRLRRGEIGLLMNPVPLRAAVGSSATFRQLVRQEHAVITAARAGGDMPYVRIAEALGRGESAPLYTTLLTMLERPPGDSVQGAPWRVIELPQPGVAVDAAFDVRYGAEMIAIELRHARQALPDDAAERLARAFSRLLDQVLAVPDRPVAAIPLTEAGERRRLLALGTSRAGPPPPDVFARFTEHAARAPDRVAVHAAGEEVTYAALRTRALALAADLRDARARAVAVLLPRGPALVVAVLASLAAGLPWVPVDPETPPARVRAMLAAAGANVMLAQDPPAEATRGIRVLRPWSHSPPLTPGPPGDGALAYVMFTSGSTGRPKGVLVGRRALSATLAAVARLEPVAARRRMLAATSASFDISLLELLLPLAMGGSVVLAAPLGARDPAGLLELIDRADVDLVQGTPSALSLLLDAGMRLADVTVLCGGEAAPPGLFRRLWEAGGTPVNVYGPTETTIWSTAQLAAGAGDPALGRPLAGESVYVLDGTGDVCPVGVEGELCIGGIGVALGYAGQPGLTAERFVPDPFAAVAGARMYRTGDRACYDSAGQLRFLGRRDAQVKIRGARVEKGEVELALRSHEAVAQAAVVVVDGAPGPSLLAAVQWHPGRRATSDELREFLAERLPPYAVPTSFREFAAMPMTDRGKLDTAALPGGAALDGERQFAAAATPTEAALARIWSALLGSGTVGRLDNFFALGGHSLHAVSVVARVAEELGRRITIGDVLRAGTLSDLARRVEQAELVSAEDPAAPRASDVLGDAQRRLWVAEQLYPGTPAANLSLAVRAEGPLDARALGRAVSALLGRHAELRASFPPDRRGRPTRRIAARRQADFEVLTVPADVALPRLHEEIMRPFDLESGPLVRLTALRTGPDDHLLALTVHHLVADAFAAGVLAREMSALYSAFAASTAPSPLGDPPDYAGLVARLAADADAERDRADLSWWRDTLADAPRGVFRPAGGSPAGQAGVKAGVEAGVLGQEHTEALRAYARDHAMTPFMIAASVLAWALARHTGQRDVVIGADVSGRDQPGVAAAVGPLVNQVCLRFASAADLPGVLAGARPLVTEALAHSGVSYDRVVAAVAPAGPGRSLFDVKLAYQPMLEDQLHLDGLRLSTVARPPIVPADSLVVFCREGSRELLIEIQHRRDAVGPRDAQALLRTFVGGLEAVARGIMTGDSGPAPAERPAPRPGFRRRVARAVDVTVPGPGTEPGINDPAGIPVMQAAPGTGLQAWLAGNRQRVAEVLAAQGALVFRGFGITTAGALQDLVSASGEAPYVSTEHNRLSLAAHVFTPIPYSRRERLLWHHEDAFRRSWPARLWFACARPADEGGETTVADSRLPLPALGDTGRRLAAEGVMYVRRFGEGLGQTWQNVFQTTERAEVEARCLADGITATWEDDRLVTRIVLPAMRRHPATGEQCWVAQLLHFHPAALPEPTRSSLIALYSEDSLPRDCRHADGSPIPETAVRSLIECYESAERACRWQTGDVLLVDNVLAAHGRRPYSGERALLVAMTGLVSHKHL